MTRMGRRMVFAGPGQPLACETDDVADPGPGEVLVRTMIAGVCGTDAHRLAGDLPAPPEPVTFGHEGIGEIVALGAGVASDAVGTPVREGDVVYFSPSSLAVPGVAAGVGCPSRRVCRTRPRTRTIPRCRWATRSTASPKASTPKR